MSGRLRRKGVRRIMVRRDGKCTATLAGTITRALPELEHGAFWVGAHVTYTSMPLRSVADAETWIQLGIDREGLVGLPSETEVRYR